MRCIKFFIVFIIAINVVFAKSAIKDLTNELALLYMQGAYYTAEEKIKNALDKASQSEKPLYLLELGDLYFDKLNDYQKAESIYNQLLNSQQKKISPADIYYRLGLVYEKQENFLKAAQMFEQVAIRYHKSVYAQDALDAIERCFKKNYQELVAQVDNYPITRIEFEDRMSLAPGTYETFEKKNELLDEMINERLLFCEALKRGYHQTTAFKDQVSEARKNSMLQNWYQQEIINKVKITEKEKKSYYRKHKKSEFTVPEEVRAKEIVVTDKNLADSLYQVLRLAPEEYFDTIALNYSISPTKKNYGDLGYFRKGIHPIEIEKIAFKLKPQTLSTPIYSQDKGGYVILKILDHRPQITRSYKEVATEIEYRLRSEKIERTFKEKTDNFKKLYNIRIFDNAFSDNLDTVAFINNIPITQTEITTYLNRIPPFYRSEFETPEGKKRILDQIILEKTWLMELEKIKFWLKNNVFQQIEESKRAILINTIRKNEVEAKINITDEDLKADYQKNISEYKVPKQFRAREIVVSSESLAQEIRHQAVVNKIPFDSLARIYSRAPSKNAGGDMGFFAVGTKPKEIEDALSKLKLGAISKPIKQNDTTYIILKLEEIKEPYVKKFEDVKPIIQRKLRQHLDKERYQEFLKEISKNYRIEKYLSPETDVKTQEENK
ncbi:MAG: peptidyl-prolyl cis-trans isomerase [candidate division WOR-3 bacterium]|nr:peptidyl-prolyl cis-trans isomerase [candidate division WOR-3 bacterium]MCX7756792.1 peptidyl-prolyl cis-trans isomerase [candidate division WOR-3 bacterium]MDW7987563.1 peptidyl-prolyl cis-trans isomerase [candidate division WOR-3 bacterium]